MLRAELSAPALDAPAQMALDEAVLLHAPAGALVLRFYEWNGDACTFGYSQAYATALQACASCGWTDASPVRRATGGGIVFHDGDLTFSLVFPWDKTLAPETIYKNMHRGVHAALKAQGVSTRIWSPNQQARGPAEACFSRPERMDLVQEDGTKILGGALRKKGSKGLYQGSFRPDGLELSRSAFQSAVLEGIDREFKIAPSTELRPDWLAQGRALETRYRSAEWNERR